MRFRKNLVWVCSDASGRPIVKDGRVEMRYREEGGKVYRASPRNLSPPVDDPPASGETDGRRRVPLAPPVPLSPVPVGRRKVVAYTDGACLRNPGPAGLGVVVQIGERVVQYQEPLGRGTNNIAELMAILRALQLLDGRAAVLEIRTDSDYSIGVLDRGNKVRKNREIIEAIKAAREKQPARLRHVEGHAGEPGNEWADTLARAAIELDGPRQRSQATRSLSRTKR